jgi:hypothetical protein
VLEHSFYKHQQRECGAADPPTLLPPAPPIREAIAALRGDARPRLVLHLPRGNASAADEALAAAGYDQPRVCNVERASWGWECLEDCP